LPRDDHRRMAGQPRDVVIAAYPGVQSLDLAGPLEVFHVADQLIARERPGERGYRVSVVGGDGGPLITSSQLTITPDTALIGAPSPADTLIVAGSRGCPQAVADEPLVDWLASAGRAARRTASVCTGAFLLAETGMLDGRRATTHWAYARELADRYPQVHVDPAPICIRDGPIWSSGGVTAGIDLALTMLEDDIDRDVALMVARQLVVFLRRPGGQAQFSAAIAGRDASDVPLREAQRFAAANPGADLSVEAMAAHADMSPRHFARRFHAETGVTPARFVERVRLEAARHQLESTCEPLALIATACGFGTAETLRRVFLRALEVDPREYRRRFRSSHLDEQVAPLKG
jgi:transcriptional regulator GlxA family with amidase domain